MSEGAPKKSSAKRRIPSRSRAKTLSNIETHGPALLSFLTTLEASSAEPITFPAAPADECPLMHNIIMSMLMYDSDAKRASKAHDKLREHTVNYNDLRVCSPIEISFILGERYPRSAERSDRLIDVLNEIYDREDQCRLDTIIRTGKREAATYLASIPGMNQFVLARALNTIGHAAFPLDDRLRMMLVDAGAIEKRLKLTQACDFIESVVPANQLTRASQHVLAWAETQTFPRLPTSDYTRAMARKSCRPESKLNLPDTDGFEIDPATLED
ncbi:MAG: hypothetical protein H6815_07250 [Phycisphaeraceae bacterium]|nr:hypothetical protein [Phycisphaerales bacterium]MCB9860237.1 hypothetical protein [Phycisphaeraceae bacterium]